MAAHSGARDGVEGFVQRSVSAAVEPMSLGVAAGDLQGAGSGEFGKCGIVAVGKRHDGLGGADRADAGSLGQPGHEVVNDCGQLGAVGLENLTGVAYCHSQAMDLGMADRLLSIGVSGQTACDQLSQGGEGEFAAGQAAVGVILSGSETRCSAVICTPRVLVGRG